MKGEIHFKSNFQNKTLLISGLLCKAQKLPVCPNNSEKAEQTKKINTSETQKRGEVPEQTAGSQIGEIARQTQIIPTYQAETYEQRVAQEPEPV